MDNFSGLKNKGFSSYHQQASFDESKFLSAEKGTNGISSQVNFYPDDITSARNYNDVEESKIHNSGYANRLDESEISKMDEFMKLKPHQIASNLLTAGLSTKACSKNIKQDIEL